MIATDYEQQVLQWRAEREKSLRKENGWLALAGLFWLNEGENRLGSDSSNDIVLPARLPPSLGAIYYDGKEAVLHVSPRVAVEVNGNRAEVALLKADIEPEPSFITLDGIRMVVIDRPNGKGLRLWDNLRPERQAAAQRQWFPINEALRLPAQYSRFPTARTVLTPDVFGKEEQVEMDGRVTFDIGGQEYTLEAAESDDKHLEIHFMDRTNGHQTYPSGRYYYTQEPVIEGRVTIDFNFAYNPPCAFTDFATCVFAPPSNHLGLPIEAGELYLAYL